MGLGGCKVYKGELLEPDEGAVQAGQTGGTSGAAGQGGAGGDGDACVMMAAETCNALDDDCDGRVDEDTRISCESVVVNADTICVPYDDSAACVLVGNCRPGFANCDGEPANGCEEPFCNCNPCEDAAVEDSGADDAGTDDAGTD
jgi:hypothetical protein